MGNFSTNYDNKTDPFPSNNDLTNVDFSNVSFINDIWIIKPWSQIIIETTIYLVVVIFGLFGNFLSIYVLVQNRHIRTPTNMLIGNMALADLLSVLIHPWVFLSYDFFQNYQLGGFGCKSEAALECSILLASVISLSAISYDRLTAILLPREARLTKNGAKIVIAITWIAGFLISTPLIVYRQYKQRQWKDFLEIYCTEKVVILNVYWHVIITVLVWLPLTIQLICYISIYIKLNKYEKVVLRRLDHRQVNYKKKAVRMMFAVIITFLICRLPFTALILYRVQLLNGNNLSQSTQVQNQVNGEYQIIWFVSKFFIFLNAALNPLIYSVTNEKFQKAFRTTKLSRWLFLPEKPKPIIVMPKQNQKTSQKTLESPSLFFKRSIFFMFRKKHKLSSGLTLATSETSAEKYDHQNDKNH